MRTIFTRYVTWELLKSFIITVTALTLLMLMVGVIQEAVRQSLGLKPILRLIPYVLPDALRFSVPGSCLMVAASVYGRMSALNEIVALKSLGIPPTTIIWPALVLSTVLGLSCVWLNDVAVSWGRDGVQRVVVESVEEIIYGMLRTNRSYTNRSLAINVKRVEGNRLIKPTFTFKEDDESPSITITADEATIESDPKAETLTIRFKNARIDVAGRGAVVWPGIYEHVISLSEASRRRESSNASTTPMRDIPSEIDRRQKEILRLRQDLAAQAAFHLMTGDLRGLTGSEAESIEKKLDKTANKISRLRLEPHRRWANGLSCLCFVAVGVPVAIRRRNADFLSSFFVCFLPILLFYYPFLAYSVDRAKAGAVAPYTVWLGNVLLLAVGALLIRSVQRR